MGGRVPVRRLSDKSRFGAVGKCSKYRDFLGDQAASGDYEDPALKKLA